MNRQTLFEEVVHVLRNELSRPPQVWQLVIIVVALLAAWFYARHVEQRARATPGGRGDRASMVCASMF